MRVLLPALLAAALAAATSAADPAPPVFSSETALVNVSVAVDDGKGNPVDGLTASDFVLTEDGHRRPILLCARLGEPDGGPSSTVDVALLVDTSDSMLAALRRAQEPVARFLSGLPTGQDPLVVLFDQAQRLERFDREHPEALFERLAKVPEGGKTALRDAVAFSLKELASGRGRAALVLLTDGVDTVSRTSVAALDRAIQSHAVVVYTVTIPTPDLGDGPSPREAVKYMGHLAEISGGRTFRVPNELALPGVLDEILADLRAQYVIGFAPGEGAPGRLRKIGIKVTGKRKAVVRHRVGYRLEH